MSDNPYNTPQQFGTAPGPGGELPASPLAITSLVLGIIAIVLDCCCWPFGFILGLAAIITGVIALNQVKAGTAGGKGLAMAGLFCGIAAIVLGIVSLVLGLVLNVPNIMQQIQQMQ